MRYLVALLVAGALALGVTGADAKPQHGNLCVRFYVQYAQTHEVEPDNWVGLKIRTNCRLSAPAWSDSTIAPPIDRR